jgi:hypothetical protein
MKGERSEFSLHRLFDVFGCPFLKYFHRVMKYHLTAHVVGNSLLVSEKGLGVDRLVSALLLIVREAVDRRLLMFAFEHSFTDRSMDRLATLFAGSGSKWSVLLGVKDSCLAFKGAQSTSVLASGSKEGRLKG